MSYNLDYSTNNTSILHTKILKTEYFNNNKNSSN